MRILLDTHVFLWLNTSPERLGSRLPLVEDPDTELLVSAVSSWEITIKHGLGRLVLPEPPVTYVPERIRRLRAVALAIEHEHALGVGTLPMRHRDPFDRLLLAQASVLGVPLLTADRAVDAYPVDTLLIES